MKVARPPTRYHPTLLRTLELAAGLLAESCIYDNSSYLVVIFI